jgi:cytochrome c554/c'-like protein
MRKSAGFIVMTLLLLAIPALASAWTLTVKVSGGSIAAGNTVVVQYGTTTKTIAGGTNYLYPTGAATITVNTGAGTSTITRDGLAAVSPISLSSGSHSVVVAYSAAVPTDVDITQNTGGIIAVQLPNLTWTTSDKAGLAVGTVLKYSIKADANHKIHDYTINGTTLAGNGQAGQAVTGNLPALLAAGQNTITATYDYAATISASLSAPTNGTTTQAVNCVAAATSNDTGLLYAFSAVNGTETFTQTASAGKAFSFSPTKTGPYTVTLNVTSANGGTASKTATVDVISAAASQNGQCTSCHTTSTPATVSAYNASGHKNAGVVCQTCHGDEQPHVALPTAAACESCHSAALSTTTHPVAITATKCLVCHDSHDPAAGIANLGPAPAHPAVTLYTFEEIGMQMAGGAKVPVQVDANGKGMPYSPKQTCGTAGCHVKNGVDYTYDKISDHAFHSNEGRSEYQDSSDGKFNATKNKPWVQSTAMVGKW